MPASRTGATRSDASATASLVTPTADAGETALVRRRYDRIAPLYDALEWLMERRARRWRRDQWALVQGRRILELGVGTGRNMLHYPRDREVVATDISPRMLARAERRAGRYGVRARLELADAQALPYADASFDTVVATFVFCSVPDPLRGLREALRVLAPGGQLLLVEHVLSRRPLLRRLMRGLDPISLRMSGAHIDRETVENVRHAGFASIETVDLSLDVVKRIVAVRPCQKPVVQ
jgi:phosphatidylethanolamine/phosphatidyl-N-methylethanolamine N-methyltransferase